MNAKETKAITVETTVKVPADTVWEFWTEPDHLAQWNHVSDDWYAPYAQNDLHVAGKFKIVTAAKNGRVSFDFERGYINVQEQQRIEYTIQIHSHEMQKAGWQAIPDNFKVYAETNQ